MSFSSTFQHKVSPQACVKKMSFMYNKINTFVRPALIKLFYLLYKAIFNPKSIRVNLFLIQRQLDSIEKLMRHNLHLYCKYLHLYLICICISPTVSSSEVGVKNLKPPHTSCLELFMKRI